MKEIHDQPISDIQSRIEPLRQQIINHKLYGVIKDVKDLRVFMKYHVYAVWDFMSLLKTLQQNLTCTTVPWFPVGTAETRFLINEIVVGEESDVDAHGIRKSHFELYQEAMQQSGASLNQISLFIETLKSTRDLNQAFSMAKVPDAAKQFVDFTFNIINSNKPHLQSAIFTFGREDLIPSMFMSIIKDIDQNFPNSISIFKYYLERHIEIDGDHHSHLAIQMTSNLCGTNDVFWKEAEEATINSLNMRIKLWDAVFDEITNS